MPGTGEQGTGGETEEMSNEQRKRSIGEKLSPGA